MIIQYWAIVPAAGVGRRMMQINKPKQYLQISGKTILEHTLARLLQVPSLQQLLLVIAPDDPHWQHLPIIEHEKIKLVMGGSARQDSVYNGLQSLTQLAQPKDWVLVHDVARPCVLPQEVSDLITTLKDHSVGGLLGWPVRDTLKRVQLDDQVIATVSREQLWHAATPQLFRYQVLRDALFSMIASNKIVTDEADAVQQFGLQPKMVMGSAENIKLTFPQDVDMVARILQMQGIS